MAESQHTPQDHPQEQAFPRLTFADPFSLGKGASFFHNGDTLDNAADVVAFVRAAVHFAGTDGLTDREAMGLAVIMRAVEHTVREAGTLIIQLERERAETKPDRHDYHKGFTQGWKDCLEEHGLTDDGKKTAAPEANEGDKGGEEYPRLDKRRADDKAPEPEEDQAPPRKRFNGA